MCIRDRLTYRISYYALYAMFAIILIVIGLFFLGGDASGDALIPGVDPEMWQPAQTDALLYLMYVLFGLAIAATVIAAVFQFGAALKDNPANAIKSLLGLVLLAVVLIVAWAMGDGTPMQIPGYRGDVYKRQVKRCSTTCRICPSATSTPTAAATS